MPTSFLNRFLMLISFLQCDIHLLRVGIQKPGVGFLSSTKVFRSLLGSARSCRQPRAPSPCRKPGATRAAPDRDAPKTASVLEVLVRGVFERRRFLDLLHHFIVFEEDADSGSLHKIIAGYHQFHGVNAAVEETVRAIGMAEPPADMKDGDGTYWARKMRDGKSGDRRAGVAWHTQGSGKSFSMRFFAGRVV